MLIERDYLDAKCQSQRSARMKGTFRLMLPKVQGEIEGADENLLLSQNFQPLVQVIAMRNSWRSIHYSLTRGS
jgi:hypothetical protein